MARITAVWEFGGGLGHVGRLRPIVEGLADRGHELTVICHEIPLCEEFLGLPDVEILPAPRLPESLQQVRAPSTHADILYGCGFSISSNLLAVCKAWRRLLRLVRPDALLFDYSPTALLASRGLPMAQATLGTGFVCPPDMSPLPSLRRSVPDPPWAVEIEGIVLQNMNEVLAALGAEPIPRVASIYSQVDRQYLLTLEEVDHYGPRKGVR